LDSFSTLAENLSLSLIVSSLSVLLFFGYDLFDLVSFDFFFFYQLIIVQQQTKPNIIKYFSYA